MTQSVWSEKEYLECYLNSLFDSVKGKIPDELIEAFVDRIVVHQDYYEWRLKRLDLPLRCKVTGRRNNQTVEFIEDEKTSEPSLQYRQLSLTSNAPHTLNCESWLDNETPYIRNGVWGNFKL